MNVLNNTRYKYNRVCKCIISISFALIICTAYSDQRLIIKLKPEKDAGNLLKNGVLTTNEVNNILYNSPLSNKVLKSLAIGSGMKVQEVSKVANGAHIVELKGTIGDKDLHQLIDKLNKEDDSIDYVEIDRVMRINDSNNMIVPNSNQWYLMDTSDALVGAGVWYGDNFINAWNYWNTNINSTLPVGNGIVIADIDTGYTPHKSIINSLQSITSSNPGCKSKNGFTSTCYGYQFISDCEIAGVPCPADGTTIDPQPDALDLGDFVTSSETGILPNCKAGNSSWHGTVVSGIMVGSGYANDYYGADIPGGIAGGAFGAMVVPIRAIGKCGALQSDIINSIYWAISQYPTQAGATKILNNNPAQVINMSLGGVGPCGGSLQEAIDAANRAEAIVVTSAGNDAIDVANSFPSNCKGVISVAAKGPTNNLAFYSNWGAVAITASGGDDKVVGGSSMIFSSDWGDGDKDRPGLQLQKYQYFSQNLQSVFANSEGTSFSAPNVSSAIAAILSYFKANNIKYNVDFIRQILQNSSSLLASTCNTGKSDKGSGGCVTSMRLDANAALQYAVTNNNNLGTLIPDSNSIKFTAIGTAVNVIFSNIGSNVSVGSVSLPSSNMFSVTSDTCSNQTIVNGGSCSLSIVQNSSGSMDPVVVKLLSGAKTISTLILIPNSSNPQPPAPAASGGGGGGGCAMVQDGDDLSTLLILSILSLAYLGRKKYYYSFIILNLNLSFKRLKKSFIFLKR